MPQSPGHAAREPRCIRRLFARCESEGEEDAALHRYLHSQTAKARSFMETALTYCWSMTTSTVTNTSSNPIVEISSRRFFLDQKNQRFTVSIHF